MKIAWISHTAFLQGAERVLLEGAIALGRAGHEVHVLIPRAGPLERSLVEANVAVHRAPQPWWLDPASHHEPGFRRRLGRRILGAVRHHLSLLAEIAPDAVVSNTLVIPSGAIAARIRRLRHVWYVHEVGDLDHGMSFVFGRRATLALVRQLSHRVLVNSEFVRRSLFGARPGGRVRILPPAVDVSRLAPPGAFPEGPTADRGGDFRALILGKISETKGQIDAIRAVEHLRDQGGFGDLALDIVGEANEYSEQVLRPYVQEHGLGSLVRFHPFTRYPENWYRQAAVLLVCSRAEAFGRVTIEAMKLGRPVIAADSGANPDLVQDGVTGLLYRSEDVADLARKIARYHRDRALLLSNGLRAEEWASERFTMERFLGGLEDSLHGGD